MFISFHFVSFYFILFSQFFFYFDFFFYFYSSTINCVLFLKQECWTKQNWVWYFRFFRFFFFFLKFVLNKFIALTAQWDKSTNKKIKWIHIFKQIFEKLFIEIFLFGRNLRTDYHRRKIFIHIVWITAWHLKSKHTTH